jgi:hypothetical protein
MEALEHNSTAVAGPGMRARCPALALVGDAKLDAASAKTPRAFDRVTRLHSLLNVRRNEFRAPEKREMRTPDPLPRQTSCFHANTLAGFLAES